MAPLALAGKVARAHARMLLAVSWAPDASLFATGGRDNSVKLWAMTAAGDCTGCMLQSPMKGVLRCVLRARSIWHLLTVPSMCMVEALEQALARYQGCGNELSS